MKQAIINYQKKGKFNRAFIIGLVLAIFIAPFILVNFADQIMGFFFPNEEVYSQIEQVATRFAEERSMDVLQDPSIANYTLKTENDTIILWLFGHTCERVNVNLTLDYEIEEMSRPYTNILAKCILPVYTLIVYACLVCGIGFFIRPVVDYVLGLLIKKTSAC